jgi:hypothetical protein
MKKWLTRYQKLRNDPILTGNILSLNPGAIVETLNEYTGKYERVIYLGDKNYTGWLESAALEVYYENYEKDCVDISDIQTPDLRDAEQYVFWKKVKQTNMCGELCVAYNLHIKLSYLLEAWEKKSPKFFNRIFRAGIEKATGTGQLDLIDMYNAFDIQAKKLEGNYPVYTPEMLQPGMIVGCKIDGYTGRLRGQGIGHWVTIASTTNERLGYGDVTVYNPFPNRLEKYSYAEFLASCRSPYGAVMEAE